jgi:uncharacterized protein
MSSTTSTRRTLIYVKSAVLKTASDVVHCSKCAAVCCRLTVVLEPEDNVPDHLTTHLENGLKVMAKGKEGWCLAVDGEHWNCSIYENRPASCRRFVMNGPYCQAVRIDYALRESDDEPRT